MTAIALIKITKPLGNDVKYLAEIIIARFLHGTVRFMKGTVRFVNGTVRFSVVVARFRVCTIHIFDRLILLAA